MDQIDHNILKLLANNARMSYSELGRHINMTQPTVTERVRRMEEKGIIKAYRTILAHDKMGKGVTAFILIQAGSCDKLLEFCRQADEVVELYQVSGQYNYLMKIMTESMQSLEAFIMTCSAYGHTSTMTVLSSPIEFKE